MHDVEDEGAQPAVPAEAGRAAAEAARHCAFLAEASRQLAGSLDYEVTLATIARLAVPALGDWCTIHLLDDDGSLRRIEMAHPDPAKAELIRAVRRYPPVPLSPRSRVARALRTGQPDLMPDVPDAYVEAVAQDAEHLRLLRELGFRSWMSVPLVARGRALGAITFVSGASGRRYGPDDLAVAEDLAARAALAVDNARLYGQAQAARAMAEAARRRLAFLAEVSMLLATSLDYEVTLGRVARLAVP